MRTTLNIEEQTLEEAKEFARAREMNLGQAVSCLIRRGLRAEAPLVHLENGLTILDPGPDAPELTAEMVKALEDEW